MNLINMKKLNDSDKQNFLQYFFSSLNKSEKLWLIGVIIVYLLSRFLFINGYSIFNDEAIHCHKAKIMGTQPFECFYALRLGKFPTFIWLIALAQQFIADPILAGRIVSVLAGLVSMCGLFILSRIFFNVETALTSIIIYLIFPLTMVHERLALYDMTVNALSLCGLGSILWIFRNKNLNRTSMILLILISTGASCLKITGVQLTLFIIIAFFLYVPRMKRTQYIPTVLLAFLIPSIILLQFYFVGSLVGFKVNIISRLNDFFITHHYEKSLLHKHWLNNSNILLLCMKYYLGIVPLTLVMIGFFEFIRNKMCKDAIFLSLWFIVPMIIYLFFVRIIFSRYFILNLTPLIVFAAIGFLRVHTIASKILERFFHSHISSLYLKSLLFVLCFFLYLKFSLISFISPLNTPLTPVDRWQYISGWPAGTYFPKLLELIKSRCTNKFCNIILHKHIGTLPDGLPLYLYKEKSCTISYLNFWSLENVQSNIKPDQENLIIIDEFPPPDNAIAFINSMPPHLKLIAELKNPGPEANTCWVFSYVKK